MITFLQVLPTKFRIWTVLTSIAIVTIVFLAATSASHASNDRFTSSDKKLVDSLVKQWAPLVWLAPGERFLPLDVTEFLDNVHVHHDEPVNDKPPQSPASTPPQPAIGEVHWQENIQITSRITYSKQNSEEQPAPGTSGDRQRRTSNGFTTTGDGDDMLYRIPLGDFSTQSYLVTNIEIDDLLHNQSSFLYGKDPNKSGVPIYAVVNICAGVKSQQQTNDQARRNRMAQQMLPYKQQFIPISRSDHNDRYATVPSLRIRVNKTHYMKIRTKRDASDDGPQKTPELKKEITSEFMANIADNVKFSLDNVDADNVLANQVDYEKTVDTVPSFHVTYWMFYPYSQGKTMCTMSLGPLGRIPIPLIFGMCMGSKKDFGSHIGDWEHMSLFFKGSHHPEAMYVSAHDAGAYYSYNQLTETFEFRSQETRKGILQRPNFPKTVITSSNHPVLFAAQGSHGLWTAPGKHRFVRVPRLYDVNGFGTPWYTWKYVDITYENLRSPRSLPPKWFQFKGKWGNPKSKCHPLKRIGLNFCEYTDGPTGIPLKQAHFQCSV